MQFADYNAFRVGISWMLEGDEIGPTFSVNTLDLIIGLGEARVYHGDHMVAGLRASTMVEPLSAAITDNAATLPADMLQLKEVYFSSQPPIELVPLDRLRSFDGNVPVGGPPRYAAQDGDSLRFWPEASGTVLGSYYARPEALQTVTWADATTFARYPELFLYASLYEAAIFLGMVEKQPMWEARYRQLADGANRSERMRAYGGTQLRTRTR